MSGYCKGCGNYHEEDDDRLCSRCQWKAHSISEAKGDNMTHDERENQKAAERLIPGAIALTKEAMTPAQQQAARIEKDVEAAALGRELMMPMPPDWFETEWRTYKGWACTAVSKDHYSKPFAERNNYSQLAEAATRQEAHRLCREQAWAKHRKNTGEANA